MPEERRKFSPRFKAEAVQLVVTTGRPVAEVARELEINPGTLGNWVHAWRRDNPEPEPEMSPGESARLSELDRGFPAADGERVPEGTAAFFARTQD